MVDEPKPGRQRRRVLTLGGILLLPGLLWFGSAVLRSWKLYDRVRDDRYGVTGVLHRADPELGFAPIPGAEGAHVLPIGPPVPTRYDEHGFRVPLGESSERERPYLLTLGCSFTYGEACEAQDAFPHRLAQLAGGSELNAGVCAWGLAQMELRARVLIPEWKPEVVIVQYSPWLVHRATSHFAPTHSGRLPVPYYADGEEGAFELCPPVFLYRDGIDFEPFRARGGGRGFASFLREVGLPLFWHDDAHYLAFRFGSALGFIPDPTGRDGALVGHVYGNLRDLCREHGASMGVLVLGRGARPVLIPRELEALGVPIIDAQAWLLEQLPIPDEDQWSYAYTHVRGDPPAVVDWHPNVYAHSRIAELVARRLGCWNDHDDR